MREREAMVRHSALAALFFAVAWAAWPAPATTSTVRAATPPKPVPTAPTAPAAAAAPRPAVTASATRATTGPSAVTAPQPAVRPTSATAARANPGRNDAATSAAAARRAARQAAQAAATPGVRPPAPASKAPAGPYALLASLPTSITGALVYPDAASPYAAAGLQRYDLIIRADGKPIRNDSDFYKVFAGTTATAQIITEGYRGAQPFRLTVPSYLPPDVTVSAHGWDWARYLKYYARDPANTSPLLQRAYVDFERQNYAAAQLEFTSAVAAGLKDPLTLTKLAWLHLRNRTADPKTVRAGADLAGQLLEQARKAYDEALGDKETGSKLEGTTMIYYQVLGNFSLAEIHGRKAVSLAPGLVGNRYNLYLMFIESKKYEEAAPTADALAADYPRSIFYQRLKRTANTYTNNLSGLVESSLALVEMMPDDVPTRLQLLPYLDRINNNFDLGRHCDFLLTKKAQEMTDAQKATVFQFRAQIDLRQRSPRRAETNAREAVRLRGYADDYLMLGDILYDRSKYRDAVIAYASARGKPFSPTADPQVRRQSFRSDYVDKAVEHLWPWQIKTLPADIKPYIEARKKWLDESAVLKHSFVMRNRYGVRNAIIAIGALLVLMGVILKMAASD